MGPSKTDQFLSAAEILQLVQADLEKVEQEFGLETVASVDAITTISRYLQDGGGKRLRPILLLLCCKLVGDSNQSAVRLAAVVEMIHAATLVHDDVIDIAETRRGRATPNVIWGNHIAVLAGDWLYMQAFQIALRERNFHVLDVLIALTQMMVEGELLQLERLGRMDISEADYIELVHRKTAALFSACARLGGVVAGADETTESLLAEFGWNIGMAFQLIDDVLDFTAREVVLGKPIGNDLREGKVTLPVIYALENADESERALIQAVLREGTYDTVRFARIRDLVHRREGIERATERAHFFSAKAREAMLQFPDSPYRRALLHVTGAVTARDR